MATTTQTLHTSDASLRQAVNDLMIDIRNATGDTTYGLDWEGDVVSLYRGGEGHWRAVSPHVTLEALYAYLTAFDAGISAGYLAAKRGR